MKALLTIIFCLTMLAPAVYSQQAICETGSFVAHIVYDKEKVYDTQQVFRSPFNRFVVRPQIGISYRAPIGVKYYYQLGIFTGKDCLYSPMFGVITEYGRAGKIINVGVITGGYLRDKMVWREHYFKGGSFVPIIGINLTVKKEFNRIGIELSNKITPIMTIHNIAISYKI